MPDPTDRLDEYLAGDLEGAERDAYEEQLFETPGIGDVVAERIAAIDGIRVVADLMGGHALAPVMTEDEVTRLRTDGRVLLEAPLRAGQVLEAPLPENIDFVIGRLALPEGIEGPLTVDFLGGEDEPTTLRLQVRDAPFDAERRMLTIVCDRHTAARDRVTCFRLRRESDSEPVAEYTVVNAP